MSSYRELIVWQKSMTLVEEVYRLTRAYPKDEVYGLVSQMRRCAVSIPSNIAEGQRRRTKKEFLQFLYTAYASGGELETQVEISKTVIISDKSIFAIVEQLLSEVMKMLNVLIQNLQRTTNYQLSTNNSRQSGFSVVEVLVAIGIFSIISAGITSLLISGFRDNAIIWEQLTTQSDGRRVLREVTDIVRRAEESSVGSYPIATATTSTLVIYANIDTDSFRERVRFSLDPTLHTFVMGVVKPSGNPLVYTLANETTTTLAHDVVNGNAGQPVFVYYDEGYRGTQPPLINPTVTAVRLVKVQLELEEDPTESPVPLHVESTVQIRNLKIN